MILETAMILSLLPIMIFDILIFTSLTDQLRMLKRRILYLQGRIQLLEGKEICDEDNVDGLDREDADWWKRGTPPPWSRHE